MMSKQLILGGVRSGKSHYAEQQAVASGLAVTYIATATASDTEMHERIQAHRARRPSGWDTLECAIDLPDRIAETAAEHRCLLVDCLSLWLNNLLITTESTKIPAHLEQLSHTVQRSPGNIILVSSEVGLGVIPDNVLARQYCDHLGLLHQAVASHCQRVVLCIAGIPHIIKDTEQSL